MRHACPAIRDREAPGNSKLDVLVRVQYAAALNRSVTLGVVPYSLGAGRLRDTEPGLRAALGPQPLMDRASKCRTSSGVDRADSR